MDIPWSSSTKGRNWYAYKNPGVRRRDNSMCARQLVYQFTLTIWFPVTIDLWLHPIVDLVTHVGVWHHRTSTSHLWHLTVYTVTIVHLGMWRADGQVITIYGIHMQAHAVGQLIFTSLFLQYISQSSLVPCMQASMCQTLWCQILTYCTSMKMYFHELKVSENAAH